MQSVPSINCVVKLMPVLILIVFFTPQLIFSQPTELQLKKFSLPLRERWRQKPTKEPSFFIVAVKDFTSFKTNIEKNPLVKIIYNYQGANVFLIKTTWSELVQTILPSDEVLFVDEHRTAKEELAVSNLDLSTNKVNVNFSKFSQYNGNGFTVSVKENRPDTTDIDFHGRYLSTSLSSTIFSTHATIMATIIGGAGNTYYESKGSAWGSTISSSSFAILLPDPDAAYQQYNIGVQNGTVLAPSSRGPAYDGRVKPELVAFAQDGSSGAAAIVSGISLTLQNAYKDLHSTIPSSALIKAILLNTADDVGPKGIDFTSGYGAANAYKAMLAITGGQYFGGSISNGATDVFNLTVPPNIKQLKLTLAWNDPPAAANATKTLKNDLDLELSLPASGQVWQPWVLSHFPKTDSLQLSPSRKKDSLNNVEQISVDNPIAGNYQVNAKGFSITASSPQSYFVAYQFDTLDKFTWYYPTKQDNIFNGRSNILRWESTYTNTAAQLEYSLNSGNSWQVIDNAVDLAKGYYKWTPPDTFVTTLLRMNFASQHFVSDTFTISRRLDVYVGFNCPDSFMLYWNKIPGINSYQVYRLGDKYLEPLLVTTDTIVILSKQTNPSLHYAIAPLINNKTGVRSYGYNYTTQGVGCYVRAFLAQLINSTARLDLELGTSYGLKSITWQKLTLSGYISLQTVNTIQDLNFNYTDNMLSHGLNIYRVKIELLDGRIIYSETATVYFASEPYIIYPNPVPQYQDVTLISNDPGSVELQVFNSMGMKLFEETLNDWSNTISTGKFSKGIYLLRVIKDNQLQKTLKLIVY